MNFHELTKLDLRKLDSATKYPSIPTYHEMGDRGRLTNQPSLDFDEEPVIVTEKLNGTNVRILRGNGWYLIGSRKELLFFSGDFLHNKALNIVKNVRGLADRLPQTSYLTVYFGELYGGGIGKAWKQYTDERDVFGFCLFDMIEFGPEILPYLDNNSVESIAANRDRGTQPFASENRLKTMQTNHDVSLTPRWSMPLPNIRSHEEMLRWLHASLPQTQAGLGGVVGKSEGVVIRDKDRTKIAKLRFEDYARTLRNKITKEVPQRGDLKC